MIKRSIHITNSLAYSPCGEVVPVSLSSFTRYLSHKYILSNGTISEHQNNDPLAIKVEGILGKGGYGEVYRVRHRGQSLALKIPRPPLEITKKYIENEIQKLEALKKPGNFHTPEITPVFFYWQNLKIPCYITPIYSSIYKQFPNFYEKEPMDPIKALRLFYLLAKGIKYITSHHIIHNDIKPENIMFYRKTPIITDYGTARSYSEINEVEIERLSGRLHGTPVWLPPELISVEGKNGDSQVFYNLGKVCQKTDIWGLGLILMRCLTGSSLFDSVYIKSYSIPEIFFITHYEFHQTRILSRYRQWAHRQLYRLYDQEGHLNLYKIRSLLGTEDCIRNWIEKYKDSSFDERFSSGKFFMAKLILNKSNLMKRYRSDIEIKDFFISSLFNFFDACTAPLNQRIKAYRLVDFLEAVYPGLAKTHSIV